jgi:hypothetical protein
VGRSPTQPLPVPSEEVVTRAGRSRGDVYRAVFISLPSMRAAPGQSEADFYIGLLDLLATCAPNRLVYRNGLAKREHEEAALLLQASLPVQGIVSALLSVDNWAVKAALLKYAVWRPRDCVCG